MFRSLARRAVSSLRTFHNATRAASTSSSSSSCRGRFVASSIAAGAGAFVLASSLASAQAPVTNSEHYLISKLHSAGRSLLILDSAASRNLLFRLRNKDISHQDFIFYSDRLLRLLVEESLTLLPHKTVVIETATGANVQGEILDADKICAVSIIRSGDAMIPEVRRCLPDVSIGKVLIQRDERHPEKIAKHFYSKLPHDISERHVLLLDPMLATGGSVIVAIDELLKHGVREENIIFVNLITCPEGMRALARAHPRVKVVTAAVDSNLNEHKFIVPGLGDFGDKYFGTH